MDHNNILAFQIFRQPGQHLFQRAAIIGFIELGEFFRHGNAGIGA